MHKNFYRGNNFLVKKKLLVNHYWGCSKVSSFFLGSACGSWLIFSHNLLAVMYFHNFPPKCSTLFAHKFLSALSIYIENLNYGKIYKYFNAVFMFFKSLICHLFVDSILQYLLPPLKAVKKYKLIKLFNSEK